MPAKTNIKDIFLTKFISMGSDKFYKFIINHSINKMAKLEANHIMDPANELMEYYDMFLKLYRREANEMHAELARCFRKAAHKVHRIAHKKGLPNDKKFLHIV